MTNEKRDELIRLCCLDLERQARRLQDMIGDSLPTVHAELETLRSDLKVLFTLWCAPDDFLRDRISRFDVTLRMINASYKFRESHRPTTSSCARGSISPRSLVLFR